VNTEEARSAFVRLVPGLDAERVVAIPNGYDAEDFSGPPPARSDDAFRIVHAGYLHTDLGLAQRRTGRLRRLLGGDEAEVDHLARSHVFLLRAIDRLLAARPELSDTIEVHLAGVLSAADRAAIESELHRPEIVKTLGYLTHAETVALLRSADLLFLPMHGLPAGRRARIVPGKTYEYLAAGRPILAAVPEGDARDLLEQAGALLCPPSAVECLQAALRDEIDAAHAGRDSAAASRDLLARYERRALSRSLAALFDRVVARQAGS